MMRLKRQILPKFFGGIISLLLIIACAIFQYQNGLLIINVDGKAQARGEVWGLCFDNPPLRP